MQLHGRCRRGFKLIDLMVAVLVSGVLFGLVLVWLQSCTSHCIITRKTECQHHMRQVGLALIGYQNAHGHFPNAGTFRDDPKVHGGDPLRSSIYRSVVRPGSFAGKTTPWLHSWVVDVMPYLDAQELYNGWNLSADYLSTAPGPSHSKPGESPLTESNSQLSNSSLKVLTCPDNNTYQPYAGNLSYVVNGGFARWPAIPVEWVTDRSGSPPRDGGVLQWAATGRPWQENQAVARKLGVMFLGTDSGDAPWDLKTSPSDLVDGAAHTLLVGENTTVGFSAGTPYSGGRRTNWACPLPTFCMFFASDDVCHSSRSTSDCLAGQLRPRPDGGAGPGWAKANHRRGFERVNGAPEEALEGSYPFANSGHAGGANFAFCDGTVRFLRETIDGTVYARLISPAGSTLPGKIRLPSDAALVVPE